jgi:hypothetical protein
MTLTADVHWTTSAQMSAYTSIARDRWNAADSTVFFDLRGDMNANYDVHFKLATLPPGLIAQTTQGDFHNNNCPNEANCNDPDGIPSHQPQRWWFAYIQTDSAQLQTSFSNIDKRSGLQAHEMGHALGLAHHPNCEGGPGVLTLMYVPCIQAGVTTPQAADLCEINHNSSPLLYGNDPARTLHQC